MYNFSHFIKPAKRFHRNLNDRQRKMFNIIGACFLILIFGAIILFFTKNDAPPPDGSVIELTCRDSDGFNPHTKGSITYTDAKGRHTDEDYCDQTEKSVYEMTCHKTSFWSFSSVPEKETIPCPKGCINGACTK